MTDLASILSTALGSEQVLTEDWALQSYGVDRTTQWPPKPIAVVRPTTIEQVQSVLHLANQHGFAVVPSGGRTGLSGGAVAANGEVVLSLDRMNKLLEFDAVDQTVTVQAGMITADLQAFAREQALYYPVDFASSGSSQIGGNIATNAGGIKVIRYGMTRDWVRGLTVVTGAGDILQLNQGLLKNNTGYDLRHLMIGSEGTLAVICEATMALAPSPPNALVILVGVPQFADVLRALAAFKARFSLSAFECFSHLGLSKVLQKQQRAAPLEQPTPYYALIEIDDGPEVLDRALEIYEQGQAEGWLSEAVVSQSQQQAAELWSLRESLSETLAHWTPYKNDISVRVSRLPEFLQQADALLSERYPDFELVWYGHIGDGNLHLNILKPASWDAQDFVEKCASVSAEVAALLARHGGSISAEHGVGMLKRDYLHYSRSETDLALMRKMKDAFDPVGILNPGKLLQ
ncbi:MAG: FAD-binding oxidoreductase [Oceanococcus sp.]